MTELVVVNRTQQIVVNPITSAVSVINAGPIGPQGLQGPPGANGAAVAYFHTQVAAASSWVITHNLAFHPNVTVEEAVTGRMIMASEIHHSVNQVELQFNTPRAGTARLS